MIEEQHTCRLCRSEYSEGQDCACGQNSLWGPWHYGWEGVDTWIRFLLQRTFTRIGTRCTLAYYRRRLKPKG